MSPWQARKCTVDSLYEINSASWTSLRPSPSLTENVFFSPRKQRVHAVHTIAQILASEIIKNSFWRTRSSLTLTCWCPSIAHFVLFPRNFTKKHGEIWKRCLLSFPLVAFTLLLFSLAILFRGYVLLPPLSPCRAHHQSTVITVQSCYFSFIRCALFEKRLDSLRPPRFYPSAGGYMNSTTR